jgi:ADP-heptose:LPS heptosyltransferase
MRKILIFRFSAMGDVVMLLPVVIGILDENKDVEIYLLTQKIFFPFFQSIERLVLLEADLKNRHRKIKGLFALYKEIKRTVKPDLVLDLHCVIRTTILDLFFFLSGFKVFRFDKGTFEKAKLIRSKNIFSLKSGVERYLDIFNKAGIHGSLPTGVLFNLAPRNIDNIEVLNSDIIIGIAPFAKHRQKVWGISKVKELIGRINEKYSCKILLFGGGSNEISELRNLAGEFDNCVVSSDYFNLAQEIGVVQSLSLMLSMDSANMHIAAMANVPTVSVWGATHPAFGFAPYSQPLENIIQYSGNEISCRPCSVYGAKPCQYGDDIRCMNMVSVDMVFDRIKSILG